MSLSDPLTVHVLLPPGCEWVAIGTPGGWKGRELRGAGFVLSFRIMASIVPYVAALYQESIKGNFSTYSFDVILKFQAHFWAVGCELPMLKGAQCVPFSAWLSGNQKND